MPMKRLFFILYLAFPLFVLGCSEEEDTLSEQRERLVSYLERTHSPTLIPDTSVEEGSQLPYYTASGNTVYRYVKNIYDPDRVNRAEVGPTSTVTITFRTYVFQFSNITDSTFPFWSNDPLLENAYRELGLSVG